MPNRDLQKSTILNWIQNETIPFGRSSSPSALSRVVVLSSAPSRRHPKSLRMENLNSELHFEVNYPINDTQI